MTSDADAELLESAARGNLWLRSLLCTLARRGTKVRQAEPERAATLLTELAPWPWFKGGQFLFDLMEWEDFMVDGPPPPLLRGALDAAAWETLAARLGELRALFDSAPAAPRSAVSSIADALEAAVTADDTDLPAMEPGLHLYRDVVLGTMASAATAMETRRAERGPNGEGGAGAGSPTT